VKIVATSNYNLESVADWLVCENLANEAVGREIVDALNSKLNDAYYYMLVSDDYKLWRGMEELI
jgi:hypothetical protein